MGQVIKTKLKHK